MDSILSPSEIDFYIETMCEHTIRDIGNDSWLEWHERLQKLNQQAVIEASSMCDEQVKETLVSFNKSAVLVHEAILISVWRQNVLPHLLKFIPNPETTFIVYTVLYHEAVAVSLLELTMFYDSGCERLGESATDLLEYVYENSAKLITLKCDPDDEMPKSGVEDILRSRDQLQFTIGMRSLSIIRYLAEYLDKVNLGVVSRMYETYDIPTLFIQLLIEKPWRKNGKIYNKGTWIEGNSEALNSSEAQVWLTLRHLLLDPACMTYYEITNSRKSQIMKLLPLMTSTLLDQLSPLLELQHLICRLSTHTPQANTKKPLLLETILEVRNNILNEGQGQWKNIAQSQTEVIFCTDKNRLTVIAQKLSSAYNTEVLEKFQTKPVGQCTVCGKPAAQRCSKCRKDFYCSRQCQVYDWKNHKVTCTPESAKCQTVIVQCSDNL